MVNSVLDLIHTGVLWSSTWKWFIIGSHDCLPGSCPDFIPDTLAISVLVSVRQLPYSYVRLSLGAGSVNIDRAWVAYTRGEFFAVSIEIISFSQKNYWITVPIVSTPFPSDGRIESQHSILLTSDVFSCVTVQLNYRQSLRDLAAQATSRMDAVDLDLIQLGPDRRSGKFSVFRASSRGNRGAALETTNSGGPVEVNVTKTMQIHADDGLIESEEAAGGHSIVSKPPQLHLADEIDGHSI
ncbi:hypothetical protein D9757_012630 [Collybiopsis confluens]|uniref:Uncharacterized protein n=1 Tax=Collybiopsis confluens TaxID=2823264 RepID=A0A8H5D295_9AGAR|nr:hypothetical protein D9757_012630 [Collybiopsis confluens]